MGTALTVTLETMITFTVFFVLGVVMTVRKLVPAETGKGLSRLITLVFLPLMTFRSFANACTLDKLRGYGVLMIAGFAVTFIELAIAKLLAKRFELKRIERLTMLYALTLPNTQFIGIPLVQSVFGAEILADYMMFGICFNAMLYIYFYPKYDSNAEQKGRLKAMINPCTIATVAGILYGLFAPPMPRVASSICEYASGCTGPCAMLVVGMTAGSLNFSSAFSDIRAYLISLIRLILMPISFGALLFAACRFLGIDRNLFLVGTVSMAMPVALNTVVLAESFGEDSTFASCSVLVGTVAGVITIPVMVALASCVSAWI